MGEGLEGRAGAKLPSLKPGNRGCCCACHRAWKRRKKSKWNSHVSITFPHNQEVLMRIPTAWAQIVPPCGHSLQHDRPPPPLSAAGASWHVLQGWQVLVADAQVLKTALCLALMIHLQNLIRPRPVFEGSLKKCCPSYRKALQKVC